MQISCLLCAPSSGISKGMLKTPVLHHQLYFLCVWLKGQIDISFKVLGGIFSNFYSNFSGNPRTCPAKVRVCFRPRTAVSLKKSVHRDGFLPCGFGCFLGAMLDLVVPVLTVCLLRRLIGTFRQIASAQLLRFASSLLLVSTRHRRSGCSKISAEFG